MSPEPNLVLMVRSARQILPDRDADDVTLCGEIAPARVSIAVVATCLASVEVRS